MDLGLNSQENTTYFIKLLVKKYFYSSNLHSPTFAIVRRKINGVATCHKYCRGCAETLLMKISW